MRVRKVKHCKFLLRRFSRLSLLWMSWQALQFCANTRWPIVIHRGDAMIPTMFSGEVYLLHNRSKDIRVGDIVRFYICRRDDEHPVIRRVIRVSSTPTVQIVTKGDYQIMNDSQLYLTYGFGRTWLHVDDIDGKVFARLPIPEWLGELVGRTLIDFVQNKPILGYLLLAAILVRF